MSDALLPYPTDWNKLSRTTNQRLVACLKQSLPLQVVLEHAQKYTAFRLWIVDLRPLVRNQWYISDILNLFSSCFTKPQFNNFSQTTTCIAVSSYSTINRWSSVFDKKHQSSLNDFFTVSPWDESEVHTKLSRITKNRVKDVSIGIIDDTMSHKPYAKKMAHLGIFRSGKTKRKEKGHSIVTHVVHSNELGLVPYDIQLYKKDGRTKNDIACAMIDRTQGHKKILLYIVDSWYSNNQVIGKVKKAHSNYSKEHK